ncbi:butyrate kinase [Thermanaerovibrio velox DSM 12556]|uniref:Probable butyrate kinase n=1 Tax=Thermanaerovibrio velox DSM 12556 TaxID=926567 RepID=H0UNQ9_9BACT|nr:butyrate kinase [Thermanaerovibrio velox]EHM10474.1 butyrate kinase [Thermanaerovibrio velox DSM 12556]
MKDPLILSLSPRLDSTHVGLFRGPAVLLRQELSHRKEDLIRYPRLKDQLGLRVQAVEDLAAEHGFDIDRVECFISTGGILGPVPGGPYVVTRRMVEVLERESFGHHVSNLGGLLVMELSMRHPMGIPLVGDPVSTDELLPEAKLSGTGVIERHPVFHALSQRSAARLGALRLGKDYRCCRMVVAHLGVGISVGAHRDGLVIEVNDALMGEGPMSLHRAGGLPVLGLIEMVFSGRYDLEELSEMITRKGGLVRHLGVDSPREVDSLLRKGDERALLVFEAFVSSVVKEIAARASVLEGIVDMIVITGPLASWDSLVSRLEERCRWIAPVMVIKGQDELADLAVCASSVLSGVEEARSLG